MANVKFLMGDLANLPNTKTEGQVYFTYKNVGSADNPNYVGALYLDKNNSVRIKMTANADIAEKDSAGNTITSTYIKNVSISRNGTSNTLTFTKGDNKTFTVTIPAATDSLAGLITNGAQTFSGAKTFNNTINLINDKTGINWSRVTDGASILFYAETDATDNYLDFHVTDDENVNFRWTKTVGSENLTLGTWKREGIKLGSGKFIGDLTGNADSATKATNDSAGQAITSTYVKNITISGTTITVTRGDNKTFTLSTQDNNNKVTQSYVAAADYTNWRTIPFGASNSGTEGFTPATITDGLYTTTTLSFQPSTGTVRATKFKGDLVGNADTATSAGKATNDAKGQAITGYFRSASITVNAGNNVITFTKGDNSTATITIPGALVDKAGLVTTSAQTFSGAKTISAAGASSTKQSSQLIVSASDSKNSAIELYRNGNASWQIINDSGNLYIRNNYTSSAQSTYSQNGLTMSYNTGNATFANNLKVSGKLGVSGENTSYNLYVNGSTLHNGVTYFANGTTYYINNSAYANLRAIGSSDNTYIAYPQGGGFRTTTQKNTGYLKITLPQSWTSTMMSFKVSIYEYQNNTSCEYYISGYNYSSSSSAWNSCTAYSVGKNDTRSISNLPVRFGHDGSKCAIYIGAADTTWNYVQVQVHDIMVGYQNTDYSKWVSGWTVGFTTTLATTINKTIENPNTSYSVDRLQSNAGDATHPIYFSNGKPVQCNTTIANSISGNAATATKLQTPRTINGTSFDGSGNITTANWGTTRSITIGSTSKNVNGSANVSWTLSEIGASPSGHTHNYAGSASAGGSANSAVKLDTTIAGSATQPVYFSGGKPVACTYTLGKSVPSDAKFTDTWRGIQNNLSSTSTTDSLSAYQGKLLNERIQNEVYLLDNYNSITTAAETNKPGTYTNGTMKILVEKIGEINNKNTLLKTVMKIHNGTVFYGHNVSLDNGETWSSGYIDLNSINYTAYTVTQSGEGASGTWGINVTGSSASCTGNAATATALTSSAGDATHPIYFSGGKPVQCNATIANSISGNAATATKFQTARNLTIKDSTGAYSGASVSFDGSAAVILPMPTKGKFVDGLMVGNGSTSDTTKNSIEFYTTSTTSAGAKIVAYSDRIEFVFA